MPYYITDKNPSCSGWAVMAEGDDEKIFGCHSTKQAAIDQAVAVSLADEEEFIGERAEDGPPAVITDIDGTILFDDGVNRNVVEYLDSFDDTMVFVVTGRFEADRDETIAALNEAGLEFNELLMRPDDSVSSNEFKGATAERLLETYNVMVAVENDEGAREAYRALGITALAPEDVPMVADDDDSEEDRAVDLSAPVFMREAAAKGLEWYREGLAGDGVVARTVREAEEMAAGRVTADKWVRVAAWIARHMVDLDAPDADPESDGYPSPGVVAHALWGSVGGKDGAERVQSYAEDVVAKIEAEKEMARSVNNIETRVDGLLS